jgi:F-type H+-transporting ATPase subunit gamma
MQTLEGLKKKIRVTEDLHSVVKTMKALAAVSIRQYEQAVEALKDYQQTVEDGLFIFLRNNGQPQGRAKEISKAKVGLIVIGSDQGMAGQLNEQIVAHTTREMGRLGIAAENRSIILIGGRPRALIEEAGLRIKNQYDVPNSPAGLTPLVQDLLIEIDLWRTHDGIEHVFLFFNQHLSGASFHPQSAHLLPVDKDWLHNLKQRSWPTKNFPTFTLDPNVLFSALIRQYLFTSIFQSLAESLTSENASRLAAMQNAERNIKDRLDDLTGQYHQRRQMSITEELLDIASGFEALKDNA